MAQLNQILLQPGFWWAFIGLALILTLLAWWRRLEWWPAWLTRIALAAVLLLALFLPRDEHNSGQVPPRAVMLVDQSDSLDPAARQFAFEQALAWRAAAENRMVVVFGAGAEVVLENGEQGSASPAAGQPVNGRASDLAEAVDTGQELLGSTPGQVILVSDGLVQEPAVVEDLAAGLANRGHLLDVIALTPRPMEADRAVGNLIAPANLWAGTGFDLYTSTYGAAGSPDSLRLMINGQESEILPEAVGENTYRFHIPALPEGTATIQVRPVGGVADPQLEEMEAAADPFPVNDAAYTTLQVFAPPRVLFVSAEPDSEAVERFAGVLGQSGIQVDRAEPAGLSTNLENLQKYRVIFLDNLLASQLSREQMQGLQVFTARMGGGLIVLGGRNSFTLGGYQGTLLEPMLPVRLEAPPRSQRPPIVFQLILDRSASMKIGSYAPGSTPIALAREAAMRSIETMKAEDYLGVLSFSDDAGWEFPIRPLGGAAGIRQALDAVSRLESDGSTYMFKAMEEALLRMSTLPEEAPRNRHVLVLTDGQSSDGTNEGFQELAESAQAAGITISTIALGPDADDELLTRIAEAGKGRFYKVDDASDLPRILVTESQAARSENVQTGVTSLNPGEGGHPILSGISPQQLPQLSGYNALTSRAEEGAEDVLLSSSFDDPVLSIWQYGLGRVAAWTGDIGTEWTGPWQGKGTGGESEFWAQVVRYTQVDPGLGPAQVEFEVTAEKLIVQAAVFTAQGAPLNLTGVTFTYADQAGEAHRYALSQAGAGLYRLELPRPPEGAYRGVLAFTNEDGQEVETPAAFAVNSPVEWLPADPGDGLANLERWARAAGGEVTVAGETLAAETADQESQQEAMDALWRRLLLALVIAWPVEIAVRRRWLPWM